MQILGVAGTGKEYSDRRPASFENYSHWIDYLVREGRDEFIARIAFGIRDVCQKPRPRVTVWIDGTPEVELFGVDDHPTTGDVVAEIELEDDSLCRYPEDPVPLEYGSFRVVGLPTVVAGPGVRHAWGVVANVSDHRTILHLAFLRKRQRGR